MTTKLDRLRKLRDKLQPKLDEYADRHGGDRPCVEELLEFLIDEETFTVDFQPCVRCGSASWRNNGEDLNCWACNRCDHIFHGDPRV